MIICVCRNISSQKLDDFIATHPDYLKTTWDEVSQSIACEDYHCGVCADAGNMCLDEIRQQTELESATRTVIPIIPAQPTTHP